ncbi:MAG: AAA family ATPase [Clostridiales bacterium]|nr:AAA family ATPase [Clostridiales bacterium]
MNKPHGIIIFGPNGSGKTTLGRELARLLNFKSMDIEDYYFQQADIPYTKPRSREDCVNLMLADIEKYFAFVISAVNGDFGANINKLYDLAVFLSAPTEVRIRRVKQRAYEQYGKRVCEGGDMYEQELKFYDFVESRSLMPVEQWCRTLACTVIRVDGTADYKTTASELAAFYASRFI